MSLVDSICVVNSCSADSTYVNFYRSEVGEDKETK